jgi:hypothetical protein
MFLNLSSAKIILLLAVIVAVVITIVSFLRYEREDNTDTIDQAIINILDDQPLIDRPFLVQFIPPPIPEAPPCNSECSLELVKDDFEVVPGVRQSRSIYAQGSKIITSIKDSFGQGAAVRFRRFNEDGSLDSTFGNAGELDTSPLISTTLSPTATPTSIYTSALIIESDVIWVFFGIGVRITIPGGFTSSGIGTMLAKYTIDGQHVPWGDPIEGFAHAFDSNLDWKGFGGFQTSGGVHHLTDGRFISFSRDQIYICSADGLTFSQQSITYPIVNYLRVEDSFANDDFIAVIGEISMPNQTQDTLLGVFKMDLDFNLDLTYGDDGLAMFDINLQSSPPADWNWGFYGVSMNFSSDGSAYVFGWLPLNDWDNALTAGIKFLPDGQFDESFGVGGMWVDEPPELLYWSEPAYGYPPYINCDGQIILCYTRHFDTEDLGVVAKISSEGELLSSFEFTDDSYLLGPVALDNGQIGVLNQEVVPGIVTLSCEFVSQ